MINRDRIKNAIDSVFPKVADRKKYGPHSYLWHGELFYTPHGVAERTGYSTQHIQKLCKENSLPCFWCFLGWYIPADVVEMMNELKKEENDN